MPKANINDSLPLSNSRRNDGQKVADLPRIGHGAQSVWRKVVKNIGQGNDVPRLPCPRIVRHGKSNQAYLVLPADLAPTRRADVYHDGGTCLAFDMTERGDYMVALNGKARRQIVIPAAFMHLVPTGAHAVKLRREGNMLIVDTAQIGGAL